jgi:hypothetical protein
MKTLLKTLLLITLLTVPAHATSSRDKNFTDWIDADAACSRAYDAWADAKATEELAQAQEAAAFADWKAAKAQRDASYAAWQKATEPPSRLKK